ncbi:serine/threonine-protein phosphatase with EF-hands 2-like [Aplysia californica]|uniref:Serine/threonine-protein phosphatase with EF-hands 2-like n=1 Tax=Aplysia californica TaxID=6500 RepID=A0ABM1VW40_APLCA|nr:serine/threonine-protein phosphatase with EF-hands 2-like [Aplysia californica]
MDQITKEANPDPEKLNELMFADNLAMMNSKTQLQKHTKQLNVRFEKYDMKIGVSTTEIMTAGHQTNWISASYNDDVLLPPQLLTVFSASGYYEENSNKGAYAKVMRQTNKVKIEQEPGVPEVQLVQYMAPSRGSRRLTFTERISHLERSALQNVKELILANQSCLEAEFAKLDPEETGEISACAWCQVMESVLALDVPWRMLRSRLVSSRARAGQQNVLYHSTFLERRASLRESMVSTWGLAGPVSSLRPSPPGSFLLFSIENTTYSQVILFCCL